MPKAHSTEDSRGTICSGISSSLQMRQEWIGPAPPAAEVRECRLLPGRGGAYVHDAQRAFTLSGARPRRMLRGVRD